MDKTKKHLRTIKRRGGTNKESDLKQTYSLEILHEDSHTKNTHILFGALGFGIIYYNLFYNK